jgi:type I restriction enzyme S subunit
VSWPLVKLSELVEINIGRTPSRSNDSYWGEGYPWLSIADMSQGSNLAQTKEQITELAVKETRPNLAPKGTVLFSFKLSIGKVGITDVDMYHNEAIASFPIKERSLLCTEYLVYALQSLDYLASTDRAVMGATLNKKKLAELLIPLPPLPVQKQIAAVLEKADTLRSQCQQMEQELKSLAQSVFLDMFGDPVANPKGFELAPLGSLSDVQIGPFGTMLHKSDYVSGGIPLINPTHITKSSIVPSDDLTITISKYNDLPQYHLKEGDIIMGRRGEMGRCAIVSGSSVGYFCGTGSLFIRPDQTRVKPQYLNDLLSSLPVKRWFEEQSLGATMANLNKGIVSGVMIPLPSIDLQVRYEEVLKNISERLQNYSNLKDEIEDNFNSLMQRAFKGELDLKDVA